MSAKLLFFRGQMDNLLLNLTKNTIFAHAKGKMQEWLNWPAWKASKPQKGFGGSNPPLSAQSSRDTALLFLLIQPASLQAVSIKTGERIANFVQGVTSSANREPQIATTLPRR